MLMLTYEMANGESYYLGLFSFDERIDSSLLLDYKLCRYQNQISIILIIIFNYSNYN